MSESSWRTTRALVEGVIETDVDIELDPFIDVANMLVTAICDFTDSAYVPPTYPSGTLELIERWLSAHFYAVRDQRAASEGAGSVSQSYQIGGLGPELKSTIYGVQVLVIDYRGSLAALSKRAELGINRKAGVFYLGPKRRGC